MAFDPTKVMVSLATVYTAPASEPMPANSVALGDSWGGNWTNPGATDAGLVFNYGQTTTDHRIEEQSMPAQITVDTTDASAGLVLAEDTLENFKLAAGSGGTLTVNAGATPPNKVYVSADVLTTIAFGFEAKNIFGKARRVYFPTAVIVSSIASSYRRSAEHRMYAVTVRATSAITITEING